MLGSQNMELFLEHFIAMGFDAYPLRWCLKYIFLLWILLFSQISLLRSPCYFHLASHTLAPLPIPEKLPFGWEMCPVLSQGKGFKWNLMNGSTHRWMFKSVGLRNSLAPHFLLKTQITEMVVPQSVSMQIWLSRNKKC